MAYTPTGNPENQTRGLASEVRAEFSLIETAFNAVATEIERTLKIPASPVPADQLIDFTAANRAGKIVSFDVNGNVTCIESADALWLGAQASDPTLNLAGTALVSGNLYYNSADAEVRVYDGSAWVSAYLPAAAYALLDIPQVIKSVAYTTVLGDSGKHILHPSADTTARIFTIDSNANVAYGIGTTLTFINQDSAGVLTIAITTDTMRLAGVGTTGSRTLAANGIATAIKLTATEWIVSGVGLT